MTNANYTHLLAIVDRSGSMFTIKDDMIGALNTVFTEQAKLDGSCLVDYVQFDDEIEAVFVDRSVSDAKATLHPRGSTALLDAIGKSATDLGKRFADLPEDERPGTVLIFVVTDGHENASRDWTPESIKALITEQENKWNWQFNFLGASLDAVNVAQSYGFATGNSMSYNIGNTVAMASAVSDKFSRTRSGLDSNFTEAERSAQV